MPAMTRWNPFGVGRTDPLREFENQLSRMFNDQPFSLLGRQESLTGGSFVPPVDVYEDEKTIRVKMEVPGIDEKDINIHLENSLLTVRGERKMESETKEENYHRIERTYGSFSRSFTLPNTVNPEDVHAGYSKGVLTITLGKRAEARPKQIKVEVKPELTGTTEKHGMTEKAGTEKSGMEKSATEKSGKTAA
jgi:HSP20 family protein